MATKRLMWIVFLVILQSSTVLLAEEETSPAKLLLKKELTARLHASQISFTNWAKGGDNSVNYTTEITTGLKKETEQYSWFIHGDFAFGQAKQGDKGVRNTIDRIDLDANVTLKKKKFMNPFLMLTLDTQIAEGYDYKKSPPEIKSDFWDPAYLVQSFGSGVKFTPYWQTKLGIAVKETFTRHYRWYSDNAKTQDKKEWLKIEPGMNSRTDFNYKINNHARILSTFQMFSNLKSFEEIDAIWDFKLQTKVAKFISVDLNIYALYDRNISRKTQIKQFLGIGFVYDFFK